MPLSNETTQKIVRKFGKDEHDSGSPQVQVALISERIDQLAGHFKAHKKDNHSRRGLLKMVGKRRRLLTYLKRTDGAAYAKVIKDLGLRG